MALQLSQTDANIGATYAAAYIRIENIQITFSSGALPNESPTSRILITVGIYVDINQTALHPLATRIFEVPAGPTTNVINSLRTQAYAYLKAGPFSGAADA